MVSISLLAGSALLLGLLASSIRVVRQYQRAVIFRLGKIKKERGLGLFDLSQAKYNRPLVLPYHPDG